jgi:tetratricopeptide (TPR) repeat protein
LRRHPLRALAGATGLVAAFLAARFALSSPASARLTAEARALAERARERLSAGASDEAVELALRAAERYTRSGGDGSAELPRLLALSEASQGTLAALRARISSGDASALLPFALAYAYDSEHRLAEAAAAYEQALERDPGFLRAHLNLAHLHAGAQLGSCQACDRAYSAAPGMLAPERSLAHLRRALELDRGEGEVCVGRAVQTALALGARAPAAGAREAVATAIGELLGSPRLSPGARLRLEEGLARLRAAGGG